MLRHWKKITQKPEYDWGRVAGFGERRGGGQRFLGSGGVIGRKSGCDQDFCVQGGETEGYKDSNTGAGAVGCQTAVTWKLSSNKKRMPWPI